MQPGAEPIKSLVAAFFDTWQFAASDPVRIKHENGWVELLLDGNGTLSNLLDATERRYKELNQAAAPTFFIYIDQGEELYVRSEERERHRFSEVLAGGLPDPRFIGLMSLRADFLGELQKDEPLYAAHQQINVPPLREAELREVVSRPAELLAAKFGTNLLAADIARRAAEESTKDAGALPLLSYLLDDMWTDMVGRGDGVLRLPSAAIELGGVLAQRANAFLSQHPQSVEALRRILTLKLATVREDGVPTRRRAPRSDFTDEDWRLVCELADHPNRLLATAAPEGGEAYAEVAHEAIFRRWQTLRDWIAAEREFLAWRSVLEAARRTWEGTSDRVKSGAMLMGLALANAESWLATRSEDLSEEDRRFIALSRNVAQQRRRRVQAVVGVLVFGIIAGLIGWLNEAWIYEQCAGGGSFGPIC
jgi:conflict system STAND superfamily ATPase